MILVFIFGAIIMLSVLFFFAIMVSTLKIKIENFKLSNVHRTVDGPEALNYKVEIAFYLWGKIKWLWFKLNDKKLRKMYSKMQLEKIDIKKLENDIQIEDLKRLKKLQPKISLLHLEVKLGTEDVILTSFLVFGVSTIISILLAYTIKDYRKNKIKYEVKPAFMSQNMYEIKLDSIIEIKMVHIINIIYVFVKKKKGDKNERTSNRRSYGYSYE